MYTESAKEERSETKRTKKEIANCVILLFYYCDCDCPLACLLTCWLAVKYTIIIIKYNNNKEYTYVYIVYAFI